jgi:phospholipid N-methyltransferase
MNILLLRDFFNHTNKEKSLIYNIYKQTNSVAFSPQANYTYWSTATCWRNLVPTFVYRVVSRGQRGGSPTVVNLSFLHQSHYFSFK